MRKIERQAFLPEVMREFAYEDSALPIEEGQTMSQPYIVARMVEAAVLQSADRVLESPRQKQTSRRLRRLAAGSAAGRSRRG